MAGKLRALLYRGPLLLALLALCACAGRQEENPQQIAPACVQAWTFAPGNYVMDVAGEADVTLMPEVQAFPLFCTPKDAREALNAHIASGQLPEGDWAIFRVEGVFHAIAKPVGYGNYILNRPARLIDWEK